MHRQVQHTQEQQTAEPGEGSDGGDGPSAAAGRVLEIARGVIKEATKRMLAGAAEAAAS